VVISTEANYRRVVISKLKGDDGAFDSRYIFRTYDHDDKSQQLTPGFGQSNAGEADKCFIWEVGRATSAAPTIFDPIQIGDNYFSDGGIGYNNPSEEVYYEVLFKEGYRNGSSKIPIDLFLSIGTGGEDTTSQLTRQSTAGEKKKRRYRVHRSVVHHLSELGNMLSSHATNVRDVDERMRRLAYSNQFTYLRWTGGKSLGGLSTDHWKPEKGSKRSTEKTIEEWVNGYMQSPERQAEIKNVAKFLVERRRKRCQNQDKWPRFSHCTRVRCTWCDNKDQEMQNTRADLVHHCINKHAGKHPEADLARLISTYPLRRPYIDGGPF